MVQGVRRTLHISIISLLVACGGSSSTSGDDSKADRLTAASTADCIAEARECAFEPVDDGKTLTYEEAEKTFTACLGEAGGGSCSRACAGAGKELCAAIVDMVAFYSEESFACYEEFKLCVGECTGGDETATKLEATTESRCLLTGFNSNCDDYARRHDACGGHEYEKDTKDACVAFCYATDGALDKTIIGESCESQCGVEDDDDLP